LSAGTAAKESIEIIKENGAVPKFFVIGLDRQEKGSSNLSARNQLEATYGVSVISIINLDTLISFANNSNEYQQYLKDLQNYRELWGA
jgi:orotate phosphoribosyltransferase